MCRARVVVALALLVGCDGGLGLSVCTLEELQRQLGEAQSGDVVDLGDCRIDGVAVTIPAGVTLTGDGTEAAVLGSAERGIALNLMGGFDHCTTVRGFTLASVSDTAMAAFGVGDVCIEDVVVVASRGVAIRASGATQLTIQRTRLVGPVTAENADDRPFVPGVDTADVAIDAWHVRRLALVDVEITGWEFAGAYVVDSGLYWLRGSIHDNLGLGLGLVRGEAQLDALSIVRTFQGDRIAAAYSLGLGDAYVVTRDLRIESAHAYGIVQDGGWSSHVAPALLDNGLLGVHVQNGSLTLAGMLADGNGQAAVSAIEPTELTITDSTIARTRLMTVIEGTMPVMRGSGVRLRSPLGPVTLAGVVFIDNEGFAAEIELATPHTQPVTFDAVRVTPADRGIVVTGGPLPRGWSAGIDPPEAAVPPDVDDGDDDLPDLGLPEARLPSP